MHQHSCDTITALTSEVSSREFRQGYLPDAMINYLALLGWNDGSDQDIYSREQLIEAFDLNRVTASPAQVPFKALLRIYLDSIKAVMRHGIARTVRPGEAQVDQRAAPPRHAQRQVHPASLGGAAARRRHRRSHPRAPRPRRRHGAGTLVA